MIQASSGGRIPAPRGLRILGILAAAAIAMLALSACGGGGSAGRGGGGLSGPSGGGGTKGPSNTAGGVAFTVHEGPGNPASAVIQFNEGEIGWSTVPNHKLGAPSSGGWAAKTGGNSSAISYRFHAVTDITAFADDDYLAYGFWAKNINKDTEKPDFESFYYGNQLYTGSVPAATTTATYTGGAAGIYETGGTWGYFRSAISLNANFGTGEMTGTLSGFSIVTALSPAFSFSNVTLPAGKISGNSFTHANWGGRFFGPSGAAPTGVAGWFEDLVSQQSGGSGTATLYGSFGAKP